MSVIRRCRDDERPAILAIINAAAEAYRGVIPADRWHEPYMSRLELDREVAAGVAFWGYEADDALLGVMGIQQMPGVELIRHAYVLPGSQRHGIGGALLKHLRNLSSQPMLVGTWAAADRAIQFYRQHGFELVSTERKTRLLKTHWTIPDRQIATSVVLANPAPDEARSRTSARGLRPAEVALGVCRSPAAAVGQRGGGRGGRSEGARLTRGDPLPRRDGL
jgi:GNAT superfamily N-acetyltransferase